MQPFITLGTMGRPDDGTIVPLHQEIIHSLDVSCFSLRSEKTGSFRRLNMASLKIHPPTFSTQPGHIRAAIYARVSTANNGQDPSMQARELEEYCQRRAWEVAGCYVDTGISGSKESRPELDTLIADAYRRRFDAVVVWKFDRFARSVSHLLRALEMFKALGIDFVSLSEQVDTSTPTGRMVFTVLGAVTELERSLIAERVRAGIRNARSRAFTFIM